LGSNRLEVDIFSDPRYSSHLILNTKFADHKWQRRVIVKSKYEAWLAWIVLSLCGSLFLFGMIRGA